MDDESEGSDVGRVGTRTVSSNQAHWGNTWRQAESSQRGHSSSDWTVVGARTSDHEIRSRHHQFKVVADEVKSGGGDFLLLLGLLLLNLDVSGLLFGNELNDERHDIFVYVEAPGVFKS